MNRLTSTLRATHRGLVPGRRNLSVVQSILHGSPAAKKEGDTEMQQHSRLVARGKYVHGVVTHRVKPDKHAEYQEAAGKFYAGVAKDFNLHVKLTGSWETVVGDQDAYYHILEYENYGGLDKTLALLRESKHHTEEYNAMLPFLNERSMHLAQEFAFLPTLPPRSQGGIFELRSYQLKPGALLEWENAWRAGIEARRKFIEPVGAWFSQIGRLHNVYHLWQYESLEARKEAREQAWQIEGWHRTVSKTSMLAKHMDSYILRALPWSPLR
ncbi:hypothetical protein DL96DRAFT_1574778 [Flagelloscypha sp. PMI_526]|nr:hypothetical protein DL96DRAFT_1574778 [Flagelloscypha sp. PMI_526]